MENESNIPCAYCGELVPEGSTRFCTRSCMNKLYYRENKDKWQRLHAQRRRQWTRSQNGKRLGISLYRWMRLPRFFK